MQQKRKHDLAAKVGEAKMIRHVLLAFAGVVALWLAAQWVGLSRDVFAPEDIPLGDHDRLRGKQRSVEPPLDTTTITKAAIPCELLTASSCRGQTYCSWCTLANRCLHSHQVCFTAKEERSSDSKTTLATRDPQCAQYVNLESCVLAGGGDRTCAWCPSTQQCDARNGADNADCRWCAAPILYSAHIDTVAGMMNQRMKMQAALLFSYAVQSVGVLRPFRARAAAGDPNSWLDKPPEYIYDVQELLRRTSDDFCILPDIPTRLASFEHNVSLRGSGMGLIETENEHRAHYQQLNESILFIDHTFMKVVPEKPDIPLAAKLQNSFRPNDRYSTIINDAVQQLRELAVTQNCTNEQGIGRFYGLHLRIEDDWTRAGRWLSPEIVGASFSAIAGQKCVPLYIATGTSSAKAQPWFHALGCNQGRKCLLAADLRSSIRLTDDEQRFDFIALRDFGILVESEMFWGAAASTFTVAIALERQREGRGSSAYDGEPGKSEAGMMAKLQTGEEVIWR